MKKYLTLNKIIKKAAINTEDKKDDFELTNESIEKGVNGILKILTKRRYRRAFPNDITKIEKKVRTAIEKKENLKLIVLWGGPKNSENLEEERKTLENLNSLKEEIERIVKKFNIAVDIIILFAADMHQMFASGRSIKETKRYFKSMENICKDFNFKIVSLSSFYIKWFLLKKIRGVFEDSFLYKGTKISLFEKLRYLYWKINVFLGERIIGSSSYLSTIHNIKEIKLNEEIEMFLSNYSQEALMIAERSAKRWSPIAEDEEGTKLSIFLYLKTEEEFLRLLSKEFNNGIFCSYAYPTLHKEVANRASVELLFLWPYKRGIGRVPWHSMTHKKGVSKAKAIEEIRKKIISKTLIPVYALILTLELLISPVGSLIIPPLAFNIYSANKYSQKINIKEEKEKIKEKIRVIDKEIKELVKKKEDVESKKKTTQYYKAFRIIESEIEMLMNQRKILYSKLKFLEVI